MKNYFLHCMLILLSFIVLSSCKKASQNSNVSIPVVFIAGSPLSTSTTISINGGVTSGYPIIEHGIYWSTVSEYPAKHLIPVSGDPTAGFSGTVQNLSPNTAYHIGVYATNSAGTGYAEPDNLALTTH